MSEEATNNIQEVNEEVEVSPEAHENAEALSFDELDALTDGRSTEKVLSEAKKEIEGEKDQPHPKAEDHDEEADKGPQEEEGEAEALEEEIKRIMAKQGEENLELAANTLFKHKVDGEEVDVDLQELLNNYSGKVSYDKKFQEFSSEKKEFESYKKEYDSDIEAITKYVSDFKEKMASENPMEALNYFAEFSGMKPHEFKRQLINAMIPEVNRVSKMSAEQYKNEYLKAENEYLQRQHESENVRLQEEQAKQDLQNEIQQLQEAHNISEEAFYNAFQELTESDYEGEINAQAVAEYYMHSQAFSKADEILSKVNESLVDNDNVVESLQKVIVENPNFDDDDLLEIVQEVYGKVEKQTSEKVSKKISKSEKKPVKTTSKSSKQDYVDFDDL